jgi:D-alanyl-D-alanine carboxypeptidase/D-alanyl-D-alanine-endopeptidase (penicillin-binding protein 4)
VNARFLVLPIAAALASACASHAAPAHPGLTPRAASAAPVAGSRAIRDLHSRLSRVFGAPIMARGIWAVDIRSLETGEPLFALNADKLMMPASNMKILTLAAAAERLGWDYRFTTSLETTATVDNGVLHGDLVIRGTGDPTINNRQQRSAAVLEEFVSMLRAAGVQEIDGNIVGDDQAFDDEGLGDGWSWDYLQFGYAAPVGALQFNENVASAVISPGARAGDPVAIAMPEGTGLTLVNRAVTAPEDSQENIEVRRDLFRSALEVTGSIPAAGSTVSRTFAVVNPTVYFAKAVEEALVQSGIRVKGGAVDIDEAAPDGGSETAARRVLGSTMSPPLRDIATVLMKVSQNLYAETLIKAIGATREGVGSFESGRRGIADVLTSWNIAADGYAIFDGSGLSRYNYVSASTLTTVLERMYRDPRHRDAFAATLPIAGRDGTISTRMRHTPAEGNAIAKTGSIANVRSLSGYIRTRDGEPLVFSILSNDFLIPAATVNWIADLAVEILASFSRK